MQVATYVSGTTYLDTALSAGTPYYYVVTAVNEPEEGTASAEVAVTPTGPLNPPSGVAVSNGNGQVIISWNPISGATGYVVERATTSGGAFSVIGTTTGGSFTDTSVTNGSSYYYVVAATNTSGTSANYSGQAQATPSLLLSAAEMNPPVLSLTGTGAGSTAELTTNGSVAGHNYQIQCSQDLVNWQNAPVSVQIGNGGNLKFAVSPLTASGEFFRVLVTRP
jgi:cellulose 1,4-beta-cellobiosidase